MAPGSPVRSVCPQRAGQGSIDLLLARREAVQRMQIAARYDQPVG